MSSASAACWALPFNGSRFEAIKRDNAEMNSNDWIERLTLLTYRLANYVSLNLADDAAMLAFIFC